MSFSITFHNGFSFNHIIPIAIYRLNMITTLVIFVRKLNFGTVNAEHYSQWSEIFRINSQAPTFAVFGNVLLIIIKSFPLMDALNDNSFSEVFVW